MLEVEDKRFGQGRVLRFFRLFRCVVDEGDFFVFLLPARVPRLGIFVVPLLLEDGSAVSGELDDEDAMDFGGDAAAAGVEALELFGGMRRKGYDGKNEKRGDHGSAGVESHGR